MTFSRNAWLRPCRSRFGAVISMQLATILGCASDTKTVTPSRAIVLCQISRARSIGSTGALTSDARNRSSNASRSSIVARLATGIRPIAVHLRMGRNPSRCCKGRNVPSESRTVLAVTRSRREESSQALENQWNLSKAIAKLRNATKPDANRDVIN